MNDNLQLGGSVGRQLIQDITQDKTVSQEAKEQISEHFGKVFEALDSKDVDNTVMMERLAMVTNVFRTLSHSSSGSLNDVQKLKLMHAFVNVTDEVRDLILEKLEQRQTSEADQGWMEQMAAKTSAACSWLLGSEGPKETTEKEVISAINNFQEAMNDPELEISLTKVKQVLGLVLKAENRGEDAEQVQDMSVIELVNFLETVHAEKKSSADEKAKELMPENRSYLDLAYETIDQAVDTLKGGIEGVHQRLINYKDDKVRGAVSGLKPEVYFNRMSFKEYTEDFVKSYLGEKGMLTSPANKITASLRANLATNVNKIADERNLARTGIRVNERVAEILGAVREVKEDSSGEKFLEKLGCAPGTTVGMYRKEVNARMANNVVKLLSKNPTQPNEVENHVGKNIFKKIKAGLNKFVRKIKTVFLKTSIKAASPAEQVKFYLPEDYTQLEEAADKLGLGKEAKKFGQQAELITLALLDALLGEMGAIVVESEGKADPNVSNFSTKEESNQAFRESAGRVGDELAKFRPSSDTSLSQQGLFGLVSLFGGTVAKKQGTGDSIFDLATPASQELGIAWKEWLTG